MVGEVAFGRDERLAAYTTATAWQAVLPTLRATRYLGL